MPAAPSFATACSAASATRSSSPPHTPAWICCAASPRTCPKLLRDALVRRLLGERERRVASANDDHVTLLEVAREHALRQLVLDIALDCPLERPRAVLRIPALFNE